MKRHLMGIKFLIRLNSLALVEIGKIGPPNSGHRSWPRCKGTQGWSAKLATGRLPQASVASGHFVQLWAQLVVAQIRISTV